MQLTAISQVDIEKQQPEVGRASGNPECIIQCAGLQSRRVSVEALQRGSQRFARRRMIICDEDLHAGGL